MAKNAVKNGGIKMKIDINERYLIVSDENQFILQEKKTVEKADSKNIGQEYITNIGYFGKLESALNTWIDREIKLSDAEGIPAIMKLLKELRKQVKVMCQGI